MSKPDPRHAVGWKLFRSGLLNLVNFAVGIPVMLALVPFLLRSLGREGYGVWTAANTLIGLSGLIQLGVVAAVVKLVAEHAAREEDEELSRVLSSALVVHVGLSLGVAVLWAGADEWLARWAFDAHADRLAGLRNVVWGSLALFLARFPLISYSGVISGVQRQDLVQVINLGSTLSFAGTAVVLLRSGRGVAELVWASAAIGGLATLAYIFTAHRLRPGLKVTVASVTMSSVRRVLSFGMRMWASSISGTVHLSTDKMTLVSGLGRTDLVGLYHIAQETVEKIQSIPVMVLGPLMAGASDLKARGEHDAVQGLYRRAQRYNWIITVLMFGGAFAVGAPFIKVWLRDDQPYVTRSLYVLCVGWAASALSIPALHMLNGMGFPGDGMSASFMGAALNVVLALGIAFGSGPDWLAAGTSLAFLFEAIWLLGRFHGRTRYPWRESLVPEVPRVLVAAVVAGFVGAPLAAPATRANPLPLVVGGLTYCAVYAVLVVLLGAVDRRDAPVFERLLGRVRH